ncbi:unnamed protein product [Candidula unifasciata]|uniref:Uncharacterized protein n=1 Tax=Candidula unifasciata TaxID=100452 RepID=A0A8S3ZPM9_9EUPU|nr:unnamed protein product [Candidula unifasciata]
MNRTEHEQTLFGTVQESTHMGSLKNSEGRCTSEGHMEGVLKKFKHDKLETARGHFLQQKSLFGEADKHLKMKQEQALTFSNDNCFSNHNVFRNSKTARAASVTANQTKHVEANEPRLATPKNSLLDETAAINNVTRLFPIEETTAAYNRNRENGWRRFQPISNDLMQQSKPDNQQSHSFVELPANIKHKFGSRNCEELLCDKDLVALSIDRQKPLFRHQRSSKIQNATSLQVNLDGDYENIGQNLRYDIFPGFTTDHTISQGHQDFTNQVHLRRGKNPDTFHHKRDDLIIWSEQNILRERTKKAWDEKFTPDRKQP